MEVFFRQRNEQEGQPPKSTVQPTLREPASSHLAQGPEEGCSVTDWGLHLQRPCFCVTDAAGVDSWPLREKGTLYLSLSQLCLFCKHKGLNILLFLVLQSSQNKYLPSKATVVIIITVISSSTISLTLTDLRSQVKKPCVVCLDNDFLVETSCWKSIGSNSIESLVSCFSELTQNLLSQGTGTSHLSLIFLCP